MDPDNLDCMSIDELKEFQRLCLALESYASNKRRAMQAREKGHITTALKYEAICDRKYAELPESARWLTVSLRAVPLRFSR